MGTGNYSATSNNMRGLGGPLLVVPNVTAHPSTASVTITVLSLLCSFNVPIKELTAIITEYRRCYVFLSWAFQSCTSSSLSVTISVIGQVSVPNLFSTVTVYVPVSVFLIWSICRTCWPASSSKNTRVLASFVILRHLPFDHSTDGGGSPSTRHRNSAVCPVKRQTS